MSEQGDIHYMNMMERFGSIKMRQKSIKICQKTGSKRRKNGHFGK
jgi:hypothetical protein